MTALMIIARVLFAPVFVIGGYHAYKEPGGRVAKAAALLNDAYDRDRAVP